MASVSLFENPPFAWLDMCFTYPTAAVPHSHPFGLNSRYIKEDDRETQSCLIYQTTSIHEGSDLVVLPESLLLRVGNRGNSYYILVPHNALLTESAQDLHVATQTQAASLLCWDEKLFCCCLSKNNAIKGLVIKL